MGSLVLVILVPRSHSVGVWIDRGPAIGFVGPLADIVHNAGCSLLLALSLVHIRYDRSFGSFFLFPKTVSPFLLGLFRVSPTTSRGRHTAVCRCARAACCVLSPPEIAGSVRIGPDTVANAPS